MVGAKSNKYLSASLAFAALISVSTAALAQNGSSLAKNRCHDSLGIAAGTSQREQVCALTNRKRETAGFVGLQLDAALSQVAQAHAEDMFARGYFDHESPDGGTMSSRLESAGIDYSYAGENIARGQESPEQVMQSWMKSTGHRENILKAPFRKIGVGYYKNYWVQVFTD